MKIKYVLSLMMLISPWSFAENWHTVQKPTNEPTKIYGSYANGCFSGGKVMPIVGEGFQQVRPSRNRHYGDESLLVFIESLGKYAKAQNKIVILGDLSQPRGGPMNFGHSSHQIGLDVDIWFESIGKNGLSPKQVEGLETPSLVDMKNGVISKYWQPYYRDLIHQAALYPKTERIFVNPVIKAYLCETEKDKSWLYKVRPWFGHDSHFHVRLVCPKNQKDCEPQFPVAKNSGCDEDLQNWVKDQADLALGIKKPAVSKGKSVSKIMPKMCQKILNQ
ncbi:penicillin-insensitive murein endopeptidase [Wohlfahrtiimonas larvae]|uniref:Penicillin-insensitive murein endopeptidase n=1 Tax=Wohlfahrtiimonas larvae TaxID=1157986 RepID=A0ABP9MIT9_9GAMM|nr:penicillin-insensitive murein endopeptidase [Wohlfahrtiimonas larvae]